MKKAMAASLLAALIIGLVMTGIGAKLLQKMSQGTSKFYDKSLCKESVILNSKARIPVANKEEFQLDCPTRYVTIDKNKITLESRNYEEEIKICKKKDGKEYQKCLLAEANKQIATLFFDCWDQFAAGRIQVLSSWNTDRQCVLCARFEFSKDVQEAFKDIAGKDIGLTSFRNDQDLSNDLTLDNYMRSKKPPLHEISYYEFTLDPTDVFKMPYYDYSLNEPYAVIFKAMNEHQLESILPGFWKFAKEHRLTIPFTDVNINPVYDGTKSDEKPEFVNIMDMVPYSKVAAECDALQ
jgi:hypothetical protein